MCSECVTNPKYPPEQSKWWTVMLSCLKYWQVRSAPHRHDFKCNLFQCPTEYSIEDDPLVAVCNHQLMLLTQLATRQIAQGAAAHPRQAVPGWLAPHPKHGHECWSNTTRKPAHHMAVPHSTCVPHSCRSQPLFLSWELCSTHGQGKLPACPAPTHHSWPSPTDTGEDTGPSPGGALLSQTWTNRWEEKTERWRSAHTYKTKHVWLKKLHKDRLSPSSKKQEE